MVENDIWRKFLWRIHFCERVDGFNTFAVHCFKIQQRNILCHVREHFVFPDMNKIWKYFIVVVSCFVIYLVNESQCEDIILYDYRDFEGSSFTLTITGGCYSFQSRWAKRASSVEIPKGCFMVWDKPDCKGKNVKLSTGMEALRDLKTVDFDRMITSASLCSPVDDEKETSTSSSSSDNTQKPSSSQGGKTRDDKPSPSSDVQQIAVQEHNQFRRRHGVPDVKGDAEIHAEAQRYADHLAMSNRFEPSRIGKYGENLATSFRRDKGEAVKDAVKRWYEKIKYYDFDRPGYNVDGYNSGSFTAIVWRETTHIGIGVAWNDVEEQWMIVAYYDPPARRSRFRDNVPRPKSSEI